MSIALMEQIHEMNAKAILRAITGHALPLPICKVRGTRTAETDMCN